MTFFIAKIQRYQNIAGYLTMNTKAIRGIDDSFSIIAIAKKSNKPEKNVYAAHADPEQGNSSLCLTNPICKLSFRQLLFTSRKALHWKKCTAQGSSTVLSRFPDLQKALYDLITKHTNTALKESGTASGNDATAVPVEKLLPNTNNIFIAKTFSIKHLCHKAPLP